MGSISTQGKEVPASNAAFYGAVQLNDGSPKRLLDIGEKTGSILIRALPGNGDLVYIGFDDQVDSSTGFPLEAGDTISIDLNHYNQFVFAIEKTGSQEVRIIAVE